MSVATTTTNYGLPIFAGTDRGNWFDFNTGFQAIDTAIKAAAQAAESAQTEAAAATELANSASSLANTVNTTLTNFMNNVKNWTGSFPTNANSAIFQNPYNSAVFFNKYLNLLNIRLNVAGVTGQTFTAGTVIANLNQEINPNTERALNNVLYIAYYDSSNVRHTQVMSSHIKTDNTITVNDNAPSDMDNTKAWELSMNIVLCTDGWFD